MTSVTPAVLAPVLALLMPLAPVPKAHPTTAAPEAPVAPTAASYPGDLRRAPAVGVWPLDPRPEVVGAFDPPASRYGAGHRGVDLAGVPGQPVRAAVAGTVTYAGRLAGRGVVVVAHGATRTTYEPVAASVRVGTIVDAGQTIGALERAGSHCAPGACLHWGLLEGEVYLDPLDLVGDGPVRLLPPVTPGGGPVGMPGAAGRW